jgi:hypothetical protein
MSTRAGSAVPARTAAGTSEALLVEHLDVAYRVRGRELSVL